MCNLYSQTKPPDAMRELFDVSTEYMHLGNLPSLPAIYPKGEAPIVAIGKEGERSLVRAHWGFLTPNKSKRTGAWLKPQAWNNTRDDKALISGLWKGSFTARRCLIPATSYAEATGRKPATWHWMTVRDAPLFAFGGIWKYQKETVGDTDVDAVVYSMVTTTANEVAGAYHTRMPVIVAAEDYETWLTGEVEAAAELMRPFQGELDLLGEGIGMKEEPGTGSTTID